MTPGRSLTVRRLAGVPLTFLGIAAVPLTALILGGCGGASSSSNGSPTPSAQTSGGAPTIGVASTGVGDVLVDSHNRTVYLFKKDTGTKSTCYGACAAKWPPVLATGKPTVGGGAKAAMLGTTSRSDGKPQLTYRGHPLYLFVGDNTPAAANGQGVKAFGGAWFVVSPAGNQVSGKSTAGRSNGY